MLRTFLKYTPGVGLAVIGMACALVMLEVQRIPAAQLVEFSMFAPVPYVCEVLIVLAVALWYRLKPRVRATDHTAFRVAIGCFAAVMTFLVLPASQRDASAALAIQILYRVSTALLVLFFSERLIALGARRTAFTLAGACLASGIIMLAFAFFAQDVVRMLLVVLPAVALIAFVAYRPRTVRACGERGGVGDSSEAEVVAGEDAKLASLDKPLPRFSCATLGDRLLAVGLIVLPLMCRGPVVSLQSSWMGLQGEGAMTAFIQAGIGCGIMLAGMVVMLVICFVWNRSFILVYELFVLPITFISFYTAQASADLWFLHVLIIDATYKVTLFFILMTPFLFREGERRNPMVPLLVSFALMIGSRALFAGLYSSMALPAFIGLATVVVLATFAGGGALAFLVIQQQLSARETTQRLAKDEVRATLEKQCAIIGARYGLTPREREILVLLAQNYHAPYIAEKLVVSTSTVKTHMRNLYGKFDVHSQAELLRALECESESIAMESGDR